ncbi:MAG: cell division protein SepF [Clostridia bacterium]|nr:cell division protein SepF [Clostridia bacterium]
MSNWSKRIKDIIGFGEEGNAALEPQAEETYDFPEMEESSIMSDSSIEEFKIPADDYTQPVYDSSKAFGSSESTTSYSTQRQTKYQSKGNKVLNMCGANGVQIVLSNPSSFDNCQAVCSNLRSHMTVVLNLEYVTNTADRRRIFDFVSGCCFALDCNIQKVSDLIYVIAPSNINIYNEAEFANDSEVEFPQI